MPIPPRPARSRFLVVGMVKRKMLAADEGLAEEMVRIAEERGQTLKDYDSLMSFKILLTSLSSM
jgi:hypothetical protein